MRESGGFMEEGSVEQVWEGEAELGLGERKVVRTIYVVLEARKNETYAAVLVRAFSLAACVNSLVQLPMWLLWGV